MRHPPQPWSRPHQPQQQVPDNPYALVDGPWSRSRRARGRQGSQPFRDADALPDARVWGVKSSVGTLHPLRPDGGSFALVYEAPTDQEPGRFTRFGPGGVDTKKQVLRHPVTARATERRMVAGRLAYANGRIVIAPREVSGNDADHQARMLSFAPGSP
ncbi:hypothetical protein [Streptomyces narbonensis]|uniref:hypothetical protein n=1 Tax=Streptomyces narbonensis TaxID=67333 RepID=UPI0033E95707